MCVTCVAHSRTEELAKAATCARDMRALQHLALNVHVKHSYPPCSSVVKAFAHGAMGRRINSSWRGPIEVFLVPASAPQLV